MTQGAGRTAPRPLITHSYHSVNMKRLAILLLSCLGLLTLTLSCSRDDDTIDTPFGKARLVGTERMYIASKTGMGQLCRLPFNTCSTVEMNYVRTSEDSNWELRPLRIEGFSWQPGYEYHIRYKVYELLDPPMDYSSTVYLLDRVISKTKRNTPIP